MILFADNYTNCYLDKVPSHAVMTKTEGDYNANFRKLLLKASENYGVNQSDSNMFQLFESNKYGGKDLLFKDSTKQLVEVKDKDTYQEFPWCRLSGRYRSLDGFARLQIRGQLQEARIPAYCEMGVGKGYCYAVENPTIFMKSSPFLGHISGIAFCIWNRKKLRKNL